MTVSAQQMDQFRLLLSGTNTSDTISPNFRPVQDLNGREIFYCQEDVDALTVEKDVIVTDHTTTTTVGVMDTNNDTSSSEKTWFVVGITFICLFGVSLIAIIYLGHLVHVLATNQSAGNQQDSKRRGKYSRAESQETVDIGTNGKALRDYH